MHKDNGSVLKSQSHCCGHEISWFISAKDSNLSKFHQEVQDSSSIRSVCWKFMPQSCHHSDKTFHLKICFHYFYFTRSFKISQITLSTSEVFKILKYLTTPRWNKQQCKNQSNCSFNKLLARRCTVERAHSLHHMYSNWKEVILFTVSYTHLTLPTILLV